MKKEIRSGDDASLLAACRDGDTAAYAALWERHSRAGIVAARSMAPSLDAEDLVSEAYLRIFELLSRGRGPRGAFRPYLYRVIRSRAADAFRSPEQSDDGLESLPDLSESNPWDDGAYDQDAVARAFKTLDERWQAVLWYMEVEELAPREVAKFMGISANAASALHGRARKALRSAWVEAHVDRERADASCRPTLDRLQRYQRGTLTAGLRRRVEAHLSSCPECTRAAEEHSRLNAQLPLMIATIFLGGTAAAKLLTGLGTAPAAAAPAGPSSGIQGGAGASGAAPTASAAAASGIAASGGASLLPVLLVGAGCAALIAVGAVWAALPDSEPPAPIPSMETAVPEVPITPDGSGEVLEEIEEEASVQDEEQEAAGQKSPPVVRDDSGGDDDPADDEDEVPPPPADDSDPALSVFDLCYLEQEGPGSYNLMGSAPEYGVIRARITPEQATEPLEIVPPGYESVDDAYGNTFTNIFAGTDPDQDNWWWAPSLLPLAQWSGLDEAAIDTVTIELRFFTPDGRYSPWTVVGDILECI